MSCKLIFYFITGFLVGSLLVLFPFFFEIFRNPINRTNQLKIKNEKIKFPREESVGEDLFKKVKILCLVMTFPKMHKVRAIHVQRTWGKRCNRLVFVTSKEDPILSDVLVLPAFEESRDSLWNKTKAAFRYAHDHSIDEFDWFVKADDDK